VCTVDSKGSQCLRSTVLLGVGAAGRSIMPRCSWDGSMASLRDVERAGAGACGGWDLRYVSD
jgi:hypothetical protein